MRRGMRKMTLRMRRGWRAWRRRPWLESIRTKMSKFLQTSKHFKNLLRPSSARQLLRYRTIFPGFSLQNDFPAIFSFGKL
jgi:hypothetical protein